MIKISNVDYSIYGNCVSISNGSVEIRVTTDIGPRVIYMSVDGGKNMMFEDLKDGINLKGEYFDTNFKKGEAWHIYGGHRLWKSEEDFATYAPDNYPVKVDYLPNGAIFTSATEKMTGITKSIKITMSEDGEITLEHKFTNDGKDVFTGALWALTVMAPGGKVYIPLNTANTGWLANRNMVLWSYDDVKDHRFELRNDAIVLTQDASVGDDDNFKVGTLTPINNVYYKLPQGLFKNTFTPLIDGAKYPDNMCNVETFTSFRMAEIETLSPMYTLKAGESATHEEKWNIYAPSSEMYKEIAKKY